MRKRVPTVAKMQEVVCHIEREFHSRRKSPTSHVGSLRRQQVGADALDGAMA
jgi:hypothetical protein